LLIDFRKKNSDSVKNRCFAFPPLPRESNGANINNFIIFAKNLKRKDYEGK
jgi:hypothetical protein